MRFLMPKQVDFSETFAALGATLDAAANLLRETLSNYHDVELRVQRLKELEHKGDETTHEILTVLHKTFITPFDREDIHRLASSLDDVLDLTYAAGERLVMYDVPAVPAAAVELADIIVQQTAQIRDAIAALGRDDGVLPHCVEINRLENEADRITRGAIATLFVREKDPVALIKFKELYEVLETATDKAEDVANVLEGMVLKSA